MRIRRFITPISLLTLLCFLLTGVIDIPSARAASNTVVISEFRTRGPLGGNDEFIELYNLSSSPVNIGGWTVRGSNSSGTTGVRATIPSGVTLNAGCHYLLANGTASTGYSGPVAPDQTYSTGITDDGGIAILNASVSIVDAVGMSSGSAYKEGTTLAPITVNGTTSYERKPGGSSGSGQDTDNNAADFQSRPVADPQNLSSACIGTATGITATGAASPSTVDVGSNVLLTVTVLPVSAPGVTVTADLTPIGGSANTAFYDDGTHGDAVAGDHVFSLGYTIPGGSGSKTITATAQDGIGDTATATISFAVNPTYYTIMQIQGSGSRSPLEGQAVRTTGVVYDISFNGFWIQDPTGDGDDSTSDGVFVFTSSAPKSINKGDGVSVTGTVSEFATAGDPSASPMTEITGKPTYTVQSSGNPLPTPVNITASDIDPNGGIDQLERYEGMRVHIDTLNVVAPTGGTVNEANATSSSNGVFFGVIPGQSRPFRKAGIELPASAPSGSPCCIPFWNGAPQRIRVDTDVISAPQGQGLNLTTGAVVSNLTGPLDFSQHAYTIVTETLPMIVTGNISAIPVPTPDPAKEFTVASFNMERFFDTTDDPAVSDVVLTSVAFANRLNKASLAIRNVMKTPDIIGVEEMENLATLQAVATKINGDAVAVGDPNPGYSAYLVEGNDVGGIDVGFLVQSRVTVNSVTQYGEDTTYIDPTGATALLNDRPPLVLDASVTNEHETTHFMAIVVHQRSLSSIDDPIDGPRVRAKRRAQAEYLANLVQSFQTADPQARIIVVGDFNAFDVNDGYVDTMGTVEGNPTPADQVVLASSDLVDPNLTDLQTTLPEDQRYSYINYGTAQTIDHAIVSQGMLSILSRFAYARNDADFPETYRNDPDRPERLSDHDMEVAYFLLPLDQTPPVLTLPADFTVEATSPAGALVTYTATALDANDGATSVLCNPASGATFPLGLNTVSCSSKDARNNTATGTFHVNVVDTTPPIVKVTGVADGASYIVGSVPAAGCSTTDTVSPIAVYATVSVTGGTANGVGTFTATCTGGKDAAGNLAAPVSVSYKVSYAWSGFLSPVSDAKMFQAGSTIPLKWTLANANGGFAGNASSFGSLELVPVPGCVDNGDSSGAGLESPGATGLTYVNGMFQFNWQTKGLPAGCYKVILNLDDGTARSTLLQLKSGGR